MNLIESFVYNKLKSNPRLKLLVRNFYQQLMDLLPRPKEQLPSSVQFKEGFFFGFHDIKPFSTDSSKVLSNKLLEQDLKMPEKDDAIEIGYFTIENDLISEFKSISKSTAWNYHKGCRLQWINDDWIIFNTSEDNSVPYAKILNIYTYKEEKLNFPIDTVSKTGNLVSGFDYGRLELLMPGYGYNWYRSEPKIEKAPKNNGLKIYNISNKSLVAFLSLSSLKEDALRHGHLSAKNSYHFVTHSLFSDDSNFITFLHRWSSPNSLKRTSRLVCFDIKNNTFSELVSDGMVSHYAWNSANQIIAYSRVNQKDGHFLYDISDPTNTPVPIASDKLNSDGHQHFVSENVFITDTYPNRMRQASIYKVDLRTHETEIIVRLNSPKKFQTTNFNKHIACDLHPRMSHCGKWMSFDSVRTNKRSLHLLKISP
jgi:hypothetical protein